jgi:sodium/bile acid cotransporter 7
MMRRHWFLIAYAAIIALALALPEAGRSGGWLHLDVVKSWLIAGIFLCAGATLPAQRLAASAGAWRAHLVIQAISFVVAPALALGLALVGGRLGLSEAVCTGLIILGCLPTTIGSCVAISGLAGGNQGLALVNSVVGNLAGVMITPLLVLLATGHQGATPLAEVVVQLGTLAILPVLAGQVLRLRAAALIDARRPQIGVFSGCLLLVLILMIFSDLAQRGLALGAIPVLAAAVVLHLAILGAAWWVAPLASALRRDRIAIAITASHKTAALGIPLITLLFPGNPDLALLILPVALYHVVQQIVGAALAPGMQRWAERPCSDGAAG